MTSPPPSEQEKDRFHQLLMAAVDGELSPEAQHEFDRLLSTSPDYRQEWADYTKLKEATMQIKFARPPEELWDRYWITVYNRIERGLGWILVSIGAMILLFYGGYKAVESILADSQLEWFVKAGILALLAGLVIVLVSVTREKMLLRKTDKYKEIQR